MSGRGALMIPIRIPVQIVIAALALLLAGCVGFGEPPVQQFAAYRQAFDAAQAAARDVLADYASSQEKAVKEIAAIKKNKATGGAALSAAFDPSAIGKTAGLEADITTRLQALNTIGRYNEALLALVRGGSEEEIGASLDSLSGSVSAFAQAFGSSLPGVGLAAPIVTKFLSLVERARNRKAFAKAIRAGAPVIVAIIDFLKNDTVVYDGVQLTLARREIDRLSDRAFALVIHMAKLARNFAEPPAEGDLAQAKRAVALDMQAALKAFGETPANLPYKDLPGDAKGPPYTIVVQGLLDLDIASIKKLTNRRGRTVAQVVAYRAMLANYVSMLEKVNTALQAVKAKGYAKIDISDTVTELAGLAFRLRGEIAGMRQTGF